ncbi:MAG: FAD-dependent oxidoreductase [Eubacteriales bacterium]|nr:FAD-dependent oxidoreductase [Eubacteriales bacterium]
MNTTILKHEQVGDYYHILTLQKPEGYTYQAGQFAKFSLLTEVENDKNFRIFSIASTPSEDTLCIATKAVPGKTSAYKQALFALPIGATIDIGKPMGHFTARDQSPCVLYASGIGITPIRSLIKSLAGTVAQALKIVYASYDNYIFEQELQELCNAHSNIEFIRTVEIDETMQTLQNFAQIYGNNAYYYISGSPFVVNAVREAYTKQGIDSSRFIDDVFVGYEE